jgi:hypothetical protein
VSKWYLDQYVAIFQWGSNIERASGEFMRALVALWPGTSQAT